MPAIAAWRRSIVAAPFLIVAALTLALFVAAPAQAGENQRDRKIHHGLEVAIHQKGDPYVYGADGPSAFDCSGLTMYAYGKAGLNLPRTSDAQARYARHIHKKHLHRGDLIFFHSGGSVYHVAIYLGRHHGQRYVLHSPHSGTVVQRDPIWTSSWFAGTLRHRR